MLEILSKVIFADREFERMKKNRESFHETHFMNNDISFIILFETL